ncbi:MAG: hypothetical protein SV377_00995 [Halobacteria archaeon]|nr:hypothetical protein [Halobacteria archaeon]
MSTCKYCDEEFTAEDLIRHEREEVLIVQCPQCKSVLGRYRQRKT